MTLAEAEFERSRRVNNQVSVLMLDIDKFKRVNDVYGHLVGDTVISSVAGLVKESLRPYDIAGRYGGEEFMILLPNTNLPDALIVAQRILESVSGTVVSTEKGQLLVTVSIGGASLNDGDVALTALLERADQALLSAKADGRNCIRY
jgi:diguanylate cyclase (GGDEF)-like protein